MFILPLVTVLREGLEAVIFIGGVSLGAPASSIPIPVITGVLGGSLIGFMIYK
jgi:high-affinity iron transporter